MLAVDVREMNHFKEGLDCISDQAIGVFDDGAQDIKQEVIFHVFLRELVAVSAHIPQQVKIA
jgi:hypothetical protein